MAHSKQQQPQSIEQLDLAQWSSIVARINDPAVAHPLLEVFESEQGESLRLKYTGIYLQLRMTKHQERIAFAQAQRRKERVVAIGRFIGRVIRVIFSKCLEKCRDQNKVKATS